MQDTKIKDKKWWPAIMLFEFEIAYDKVLISILIDMLINLNVPCNIVAVIKDMLDKFFH